MKIHSDAFDVIHNLVMREHYLRLNEKERRHLKKPSPQYWSIERNHKWLINDATEPFSSAYDIIKKERTRIRKESLDNNFAFIDDTFLTSLLLFFYMSIDKEYCFVNDAEIISLADMMQPKIDLEILSKPIGNLRVEETAAKAILLFDKFLLKNCEDYYINHPILKETIPEHFSEASYNTDSIDEKSGFEEWQTSLADIKLSKHVEAAERCKIENNNFIRDQFSAPKFLNVIPHLHDDFIGREDELSHLEEKIFKKRRVVLLNGLGGIGKTTLAKKFIQSNQHLFRHIAWVSITASQVKNTQERRDIFVAAFAYDVVLAEKGLNLRFKNDTTETDKYKIIMHAMQNLEGPNLLVIDNADDNINYFIDKLPTPTRWHLLITSRTNLIGFEPFPLSNLKKLDAVKLFKRWYSKENNDNEIDALLNDVGCHTLMIELLAKTLTASLGLLTVKNLIDYLKSKNLNSELLKDEISTAHDTEESTLLNYLLKTFHLAKLNVNEIHCLKCFYFLPSESFNAQLLAEWFDKRNDISFINALKSLYKSGWLQFDGNGFQMHRSIRLVIYYALSPAVEIALPLINTFLYSRPDDGHSTILKRIFYIPYIEFLILQIREEKENSYIIPSLRCMLGLTLLQSNQFYRADQSINQALETLEVISQTDKVKAALATCYLSKSFIAHHHDRNDDKWNFINKSLKIHEDLDQHFTNYTSDEYTNVLGALCFFYHTDKQFDEAEKIQLKNIELLKKMYVADKKKHLYPMLSGLTTMASCFLSNGKFSEAKSKINEAEALSRESEKLNGRILDVSLGNIMCLSGKIDYLDGNIELAIPKFEEGLSIYENFMEINENVYGPYFADKLTQFGTILLDNGRIDNAEKQFKKAEIIYSKLLMEDHSVYIPSYEFVLKTLGKLHDLSK